MNYYTFHVIKYVNNSGEKYTIGQICRWCNSACQQVITEGQDTDWSTCILDDSQNGW